MSTSGPLLLSSTSGRSRLSQCPPALLDTTMDQLRTLIAVREAGTALGAARILGREQSSVQKQLDTLNRNFRTLCGEPLVLKQGRGRDVLFTGTGEALVEMARGTLGDWLDGIHECRRQLGGTLTVGTTRYLLGYLVEAVGQITDEFQRRGIELKVMHVRTRDLFDKLRGKQVDLVCGSIVTAACDDGRLDAYDVLEWRRSGLAVLTNLDDHQLPGPTVAARELHTLPLVVSATGLIPDFLSGWFGADYRGRLDIVAEIDSVQYGFELLRSCLVRGCMLVTKGLSQAAGDGRLPDASGLRAIEFVNDLEPKLELLVGVFARRGELASYDAGHPLNLLWNALSSGTKGVN